MNTGQHPQNRTKAGRFTKGKSGNPGGRPKTLSTLRDMIHTHAFKRAEHNKTQLQHLIERLYLEDPKTYLAYGFGKPIETVEVSGPDGSELHKPEVIALGRQIAISLTLDEPRNGDGPIYQPTSKKLAISQPGAKSNGASGSVNGNGDKNGH